ncbi:chromo domain-containing protein, partial [Colletotrichum incanum]
ERTAMSRPSTFVWFGRPTPGSSTSTSTSNTSSSCHHKIVGLRELAVVFEDIPTYRRYKPGNGPRLAPITLLPVRDTTAYIRDEFFVPPALSVDGKKRLQYVVGWTDLPAARLQVDAERICEYVSPMAYEEWCAARAAERDEEERRFEKEENMRVLESEARGPRIARNGVEGPKGRKRKHSQCTGEIGAVGEEAEDEVAKTNVIKLPKPAIRDRNSSLKASYSAPPATTAGSKQAVAKILPAQGGQQAPEDDNIYEVLRLEGVQERIVRGKRVRFFHVRWKGTWPPDQNPTWEPEANIPRSLIKKYLLAHPQQQKQKQQGHKTSAMDKYLVPSWPHRKYSSVSEAFEGGDTDDAAGGDGNDDDEEAVEDGDAEEDNGDEMLLVTDEPS